MKDFAAAWGVDAGPMIEIVAALRDAVDEGETEIAQALLVTLQEAAGSGVSGDLPANGALSDRELAVCREGRGAPQHLCSQQGDSVLDRRDPAQAERLRRWADRIDGVGRRVAVRTPTGIAHATVTRRDVELAILRHEPIETILAERIQRSAHRA